MSQRAAWIQLEWNPRPPVYQTQVTRIGFRAAAAWHSDCFRVARLSGAGKSQWRSRQLRLQLRETFHYQVRAGLG
jgi:hypothetical protein